MVNLCLFVLFCCSGENDVARREDVPDTACSSPDQQPGHISATESEAQAEDYCYDSASDHSNNTTVAPAASAAAAGQSKCTKRMLSLLCHFSSKNSFVFILALAFCSHCNNTEVKNILIS